MEQAKFNLGGTEYSVSRLKAGKFFQLQRIFVDLMGAVTPDASGAVNNKDSLNAMMTVFPQKMAEFIAVCIDVPVDEILDSADASEIPDAFSACYSVNNVMDSLKNFQSPILALGGTEVETKTE